MAQCISELVAEAEAGDSQDAGAWPGKQRVGVLRVGAPIRSLA